MRRYYSIPRILYYLHVLRRNTWLKTSELKKIQGKKLRAIMKHAYENVKFYHQKFDSERIKPKDIKTMEDLRKLPIITKSEVQENFNQFVAKDVRIDRCRIAHTSGSTGAPLTVIFDNKAQDFIQANELRRFFECGGRLKDKWALYTGTSPQGPPRSFLFEHLGIFARKRFSDVEDSLPIIEAFEPDVISGYASLIELAARAIVEKGIKIHPRIIFSAGELLDRRRRELINSTFQVDTFDWYGSVESGYDVAWECTQHHGYHTNIDAAVIEFVRDGENVAVGEEGEIVFTGLFNYAMPLIRFNVEDVGIPSDERCPCGRELPLMKVVGGRAEDYIVLPSGRILSPLTIWDTAAFPHLEGVSRFRIIQEKRDEFTVLLVLLEGYDEDVVVQFEEGLKRVLKEDVKVKINVLEAIPRDRSGKLRRIISKVSPYKRAHAGVE